MNYQLTKGAIEAAANSDSEFDKRGPLNSLPRADRLRYLARAEASLIAAAKADWADADLDDIDGLAHEIWPLSLIGPSEGIEDAAARIASRLVSFIRSMRYADVETIKTKIGPTLRVNILRNGILSHEQIDYLIEAIALAASLSTTPTDTQNSPAAPTEHQIDVGFDRLSEFFGGDIRTEDRDLVEAILTAVLAVPPTQNSRTVDG